MNPIRILLTVFVGVFVLSSCTHAPVKQKLIKPHPLSVVGVVLDQEALSQGGTLGLTPFKAGPKAEANDELDRMAMMILKGIKDTLDEQNINIHVVDASQGQPKLELDGSIKEYTRQSSRGILSLEGEIWLGANGGRILSFSVKKIFNPKKERPLDVAYGLGKGTGDFIVKQAKNCTDSCS